MPCRYIAHLGVAGVVLAALLALAALFGRNLWLTKRDHRVWWGPPDFHGVSHTRQRHTRTPALLPTPVPTRRAQEPAAAGADTRCGNHAGNPGERPGPTPLDAAADACWADAWWHAGLRAGRQLHREQPAPRLLPCRQVVCSASWLASYATVVGVECYWFGDGIAWLAALRITLINSQYLWMLVMAHGITRYRGGGEVEADLQARRAFFFAFCYVSGKLVRWLAALPGPVHVLLAALPGPLCSW